MIQFPPIGHGQALSISASLYTTYLRCPGRALAQVQGRYGPESRAAFTGMLAHRVFARHLADGAIAQVDFSDACRQEIGQAMNPKLAALALRPSELRGVIAEVGVLYQRFQTISTAGWRSSETALEFAVSPDVTLRGRIDAVFDDPEGVRLVDWKTGALGGVQEQLAFYALLWALTFGELPAVIEAASVATGERYEQTPTLADVTETADRIVEMVATLREGFIDESRVPRIGGPGCSYCPLRDECVEGQAAIRVLTA